MRNLWQRGIINTNSKLGEMALGIILNRTSHVTKPKPTFIIAPLKCSSQIKGPASHLSTIHNSKTELPCQQGHQDTGNALSKRPADRYRHFSPHSGFKSFHQHLVCKLRDIGRDAV